MISTWSSKEKKCALSIFNYCFTEQLDISAFNFIKMLTPVRAVTVIITQP